MPKPKRNAFHLFVDTNALFTKDQSALISTSFTSTLCECRELADVHLVIPDVARRERLFRLCQLATVSLNKAKSELSTLERITKLSPPDLVSIREIRVALESQFDKWCKSVGADVRGLPTTKIDWNKIVEDAIERNAPFVFEESSKTEKGFRDRLILETAFDFIRTEKPEYFVFVSGDVLTRETLEHHQQERTVTYDSIQSFHSYLKLMAEKIEEEFISQLMSSVKQEFTRRIFNELRVDLEIGKRFGLSFLMPTDKSLFVGAKRGPSILEWKPISERQSFVFDSQFSKKVGKSNYHWVTSVHVAQLFRRLTPSFVPAFDERIGIWRFNVFWCSDVSKTGELGTAKLEDIKQVDGGLHFPTDDQRVTYGLQVKSTDQSFEEYSKRLNYLSSSITK